MNRKKLFDMGFPPFIKHNSDYITVYYSSMILLIAALIIRFSLNLEISSLYFVFAGLSISMIFAWRRIMDDYFILDMINSGLLFAVIFPSSDNHFLVFWIIILEFILNTLITMSTGKVFLNNTLLIIILLLPFIGSFSINLPVITNIILAAAVIPGLIKQKTLFFPVTSVILIVSGIFFLGKNNSISEVIVSLYILVTPGNLPFDRVMRFIIIMATGILVYLFGFYMFIFISILIPFLNKVSGYD